MTLTDRDKKILFALVPLLAVLAYWFLALSPKRQEVTRLSDDLAKQEQRRDEAEAQVQRMEASKKDFARDYATVVRLGKAIPTSVDMPSLIVQLDRAAGGSGIDFQRIKAGARLPAAAAPAGGSPPAGGGSSSTPASAPGGTAAVTPQGRAVEKAGETKQGADARTSKAGGTPSPSPGGSGAAGSSQTDSGVPGLDSVPLEFTFKGNFFELADLFHRLKRFVRAHQDGVAVRGRLMTITGFVFKTKKFPAIEAQVIGSVYLTPKNEGATAGASPSGPAPGAGSPTPASSSAPPSPQPPAAAATR
jgi:hypothetical protein